MDSTRGGTGALHQRLTVVWLGDAERASLVAALGDGVRLVGRETLEELARPAAQRRRERDAISDAVLEEELEALEARRAAAESALDGQLSEHRRLREGAEWCEQQPEKDARAAAQIGELDVELESHGRRSRQATRQLERVLEQRAAVEAALEEARAELAGLHATGIDETDVRRQMETASHELRAASTEYQEAMKEVARRRAELAALEEATARNDGAVVPGISDGDQLQAMGRALRAKFEPETSPATVDGRAVERARSDVRGAQERADEAAHRLSTVRQTIDGFETELIARSNDGDARASRHDAAIALETQVLSVERQLSEAEGAARSEMDDVTRSVSRAELALERLRQESRDRRLRLRDLVALVPAGKRPPPDDDPVQHAGTIATVLRDLAVPMQRDIDQASGVFDALRIESDEKLAELERRRLGRETILPEDRRAALQGLMDEVAVPVVLDDAVTIDDVVPLDGGVLSVADLAGLTDPTPLVVLTGDSAVAGWAIELPDDRGRLANAAELWSWAHAPQPSSAAPSAAAQRPEPSPSR